MGCLFADPELIDPLQRGQNPFAVNSLALMCACIAIRYDAQVRKYAETIRANRAAFCRWLDAHEIPYVPSSANFVLTRVGEHAPEIARKLRAKKILVRDWSYDPHLKGYLRFTIGSQAQMRRLMAELASPARPDPNSQRRGSLEKHGFLLFHRMVCMKARTAIAAPQDRGDRHPRPPESGRPRHVTKSPRAFASSITCWSFSRGTAASIWISRRTATWTSTSIIPWRTSASSSANLLREALGSKKGINRAGYFLMPMDETLAVAAIDLSGRPYLVLNAPIKVRYVGDLQTELLEDFFHGFTTTAARQRAPEGGVRALQPPRHRSAVQSLCARAALCLLARPPLAIAASQHQGASMIAVLDYGGGNVGSVLKAIEYLGLSGERIDQPAALRAAEKIIFPGQGHFGAMMKGLADRDMLTPLREAFAAENPSSESAWACRRFTNRARKPPEFPAWASCRAW